MTSENARKKIKKQSVFQRKIRAESKKNITPDLTLLFIRAIRCGSFHEKPYKKGISISLYSQKITRNEINTFLRNNWIERKNNRYSVTEKTKNKVREMIKKEDWKPIDDTKKDGKPFLAIIKDDAFPAVVKWVEYEEGDVEDGTPGYFSFEEDLIADVCGEAIPTHYCDFEMPDN